MQAVRRVLASAPAAAALVALLIGAAIWSVGEYLSIDGWKPLGQSETRWIVTAAVAAAAAAVVLLLQVLRRRRERALIAAVTEAEPDAADAERAAVDAKFREALVAFSRMRGKGGRFGGGGRGLHALPWYVMIGPPGAGKTSAIVKVFDRESRAPIDGGAGTRHCEWIFTERAVFLDTAGRFTEQQNGRVDAEGWRRFLRRLARQRPTEPVNGVIVAISLEDLMREGEEAARRHGAAVRARLAELTEALGARPPVYALFTKADLLAGFEEFFLGLSQEEERQVWGATFAAPERRAPEEAQRRALAAAPLEFDALVDRLGAAMFPTIQDAGSAEERDRVFGFVSEFAALKAATMRFLSVAFEPSTLDAPPPPLRGFYFASATQEGQPMDRLLAEMAAEYGIPPEAAPLKTRGKLRVFFLDRLLKEVVIREAGLMARLSGRRLAVGLARRAALAACLVAPILLGLGWWSVLRHDAAMAEGLARALAAYEAEIAALPVTEVTDDGVLSVQKALDGLAAARGALEAPRLGGLGVSRIGDLRLQADAAYRRALADLLRPRLLVALEDELGAAGADGARVYRALKAYLMLGRETGRIDAAAVTAEIRRLWAAPAGPRVDELDAEAQAAMAPHLAALLAGPLQPYGREAAAGEDPRKIPRLDDRAIAAARAALPPIEVRALESVAVSEAALALPGWSVSGAAEGAATVFESRSGAKLEREIPGLYTRAGWVLAVAPALEAAVDAALAERWLDGAADASAPTEAQRNELRAKVRREYARRFEAAWTARLGDLRVRRLGSAADAETVLLALVSETRSPLRDVLASAAREFDLAAPADKADLRLAAAAPAAAAALPGVAPTVAPDLGALGDLAAFVGKEGRAEGLSGLIAALGGLRADLGRAADSAEAGAYLLAGTGAARAALSLAGGAPEPVRGLIEAMILDADGAAMTATASRVEEAWQNEVYRLCASVTGGYPFDRRARDAPLADFAALFGPDGAFARFRRDRLGDLLSTTGEWGWSRQTAFDPATPKLLQQADEIGRAFFSAGEVEPRAPVDVKAPYWTEELSMAELRLGGAGIRFGGGEAAAGGTLDWPGREPGAGAEVRLTPDYALPPAGAEEPRWAQPGVWGLFRLAYGEAQRVSPIGGGLGLRLGFDRGAYGFDLEISFRSTVNPFSVRKTMEGFRCRPTL